MADEQKHELVMPFVTVASVGGPHDDAAYAAGWEMGALDSLLGDRHPPFVRQTIHTVNAPQADLLAMKHGYTARVTPLGDEWAELELTRPIGKVAQ